MQVCYFISRVNHEFTCFHPSTVLSQTLNAGTAATKSNAFFLAAAFHCRLLEVFFALAPFRLSTAQLMSLSRWREKPCVCSLSAQLPPHRFHHLKWLLTTYKTTICKWLKKCCTIDSKSWCVSHDRSSPSECMRIVRSFKPYYIWVKLWSVVQTWWQNKAESVCCARVYSFCLISFTCQHDVCFWETETKKVFLPPWIALIGSFIHRENVHLFFIDFVQTYFSGWKVLCYFEQK